jgi:hypothetical protein
MQYNDVEFEDNFSSEVGMRLPCEVLSLTPPSNYVGIYLIEQIWVVLHLIKYTTRQKNV